MKKQLLLILAGLFLGLALGLTPAAEVSAAPAAPVDLTLTQPDGSTFTARQWGDEWLNGFETGHGYTILQMDDDWWVYAERGPDGTLVPFLQAGEPLPAGALAPQVLEMRARPDEPDTAHLLTAPPAIHAPSLGDRPVLVLLVKFSDRAETYPASHFQNIVFGASGSVRDYYRKASFNKFNFNPANETYGTNNDGIVGWVNLGYPHPNTGGSTGLANQMIVRDALVAADPHVNFAAFDTNGDGYISSNELNIVVVVAGYEAATTNLTPSVWAHRWNLNQIGPPTLDGVVIGDFFNGGGYSQVGEIHKDHAATFGIIAHELGHDIGWPDTYDVDGSSNGVGNWDIMAGGAWNSTAGNYAGSSPALPNAWFKWLQGWLEPTAVNGTLTGQAIPQAATNASAFLLRPNPNGVDWVFNKQSGTGEFFLVENRQLASYDAGLPGCGLLIWHIDESVTYTNQANANENHPLVRLLQADGQDHLKSKTNRGDAGDPYPGTSNNRTLNYTSTPNSRLYSGQDSLVAVTGISDCAATMTANLAYDGPTVTASLNFLPLVIRGTGGSVPTTPILNGDFEQGPGVGWTEFSTNDFPLILQFNPGMAHSGNWGAWLGGVDNANEISRLSQQVSIPSDQYYLQFYYDIDSLVPCGQDYFRVKINNTTVKTYNLCKTNNSNNWVKGTVNLSNYKGSTVTLMFEAATVNTSNSTYSSLYLDTVSLSKTSTAAAEVWGVPLGLDFELLGSRKVGDVK